MVVRMWRGWAAVDKADEIAAHLRDGALAAFRSAAGNVSAEVLLRPIAGGVEVVTLSLWESGDVLPLGVDEDHRLLVARQTIAEYWEVAATPEAVARAA